MTFYFKSTMNENICPSGTSPRRLGALVAVLFLNNIGQFPVGILYRFFGIREEFCTHGGLVRNFTNRWRSEFEISPIDGVEM